MDDSDITHKTLFEKLIEHEGKIVKLTDDVHEIRETLKPIARGINSIAWSFKGLLLLGAGSAAVVGIIELAERF
jgi:hypothetical protein